MSARVGEGGCPFARGEEDARYKIRKQEATSFGSYRWTKGKTDKKTETFVLFFQFF